MASSSMMPLLLILLTLSYQVESFPSGAPAGACSTLTPALPQHIDLPQTTPVPYEVDLVAFDDGNGGFFYLPGVTYSCMHF